MKQSFKITELSILVFTLLLTLSCLDRNRPLLETKPASEISYTTAISGATVINKRGAEMKSRGVCWSRSENPALSDYKTDEGRGMGGFESRLTGLVPETTYYIRSYAILENDTIYGNVLSFSTLKYGTLTDIEGNRYRTITLGSRTWMAQNLATTRYNDGTVIQYVTDKQKWANITSPAYCWYKNSEEAFKEMYGAIYNWHTVNTGKLCPEGWHVPSDMEWDRLAEYLGGWEQAGGKMKEIGDTYWLTPNTGATNESRFSALPGGLRYFDGEFRDFGFGGYWWSSSELSDERAFFRHIFYEDISLFRFDNDKRNGFYVRCILD